ncbi:MAG: biotin/lipoate protein ligase [Gemmatimonadales bacterium]|nr:biotin/lipoate protein ligase [Gemmatimonadales bacterium]
MARDSALQARAAETQETVFSVYSWTRPTLSFGRNQPAIGLYDVQRIETAGLDVVRRPTGGRAILHDHEVTYSVTAPIDAAEPLREAYSRINRILLDGLARLGVVAGIAAPGERAPAPSIRPCFETPGEGELVAGGGKLVGSAQWRDGGALLQHGSILVEDDQSSLNSFAAGAMNESFSSIGQPATLTALLGRAPDATEVASAMFDAVRALEDAGATELDEDEIRAAALRQLPRFLDTEWTWRR